MSKKRNSHLDNLLNDNPQVDSSLLFEVMELLGNLRKSGVRGATYNVASPFGGYNMTQASSMGSEDCRCNGNC